MSDSPTNIDTVEHRHGGLNSDVVEHRLLLSVVEHRRDGIETRWNIDSSCQWWNIDMMEQRHGGIYSGFR